MRTSRLYTALCTANIPLNTTIVQFVLYALFFCSGCAALIYQIMWQRMLFTVFGVDLISTTIIISVFMFGLGVGGLAGGRLADKMPARLLALYVAIELGIAIFGFASPVLIDLLGAALFANSAVITAFASFIILAVPTILMGATFPILVTHVNQTRDNIGESVGGIYFANTLGGAMGAFMAGFVLLSSMDMSAAINCAVVLNLVIAVTAFILFKRNS